MPSRLGPRPLKAWRYVAVFCPELMLCLASVRIGPARQAFWAVWDREERQLHERTRAGRGRVRQGPGWARVSDAGVEVELRLTEVPGVESICQSGRAYAWTRKQGGLFADGIVRVGRRTRRISGQAVIDDTAAYYQRHTRWRWSAGVGTVESGGPVAWNLVSGVNDPPTQSERTVWVDGLPTEVPPVEFAADLSAVGGLQFWPEAVPEHRQNLLLVRSRYRQPFGTFTGELHGAGRLTDGLGVMEDHEVWW
jgi:hypothetical protein